MHLRLRVLICFSGFLVYFHEGVCFFSVILRVNISVCVDSGFSTESDQLFRSRRLQGNGVRRFEVQ